MGVTLWCEYAKVPDPTPGSSLEITECGIVVEGHNVCLGIPGFKGFQIIGQCNPNSGKEPNGARGLIVRFGSDYYVKTEPTIWQGQSAVSGCVELPPSAMRAERSYSTQSALSPLVRSGT